MKAFLIVAATLSTVMFPPPSSADTITRHELLTTCEARVKTETYVHYGRETNIPKNTVLEQISKGLSDKDAVLQSRKLVDDIYASPKPAGFHDWSDEAMRSCIASHKSNLPMDDSSPLLLWRVVKNWDRAAAATGHQGTVAFEVLIKADSTIGDVKIVKSSGFEKLDNAAVAEAQRWQWRAMIRDGKFCPSTILLSLVSGGTAGEAPQGL